jgi:succinate-semialdehyde dehydrogenase/glutarate-semialdehyde dehydrogenase
MLAIDPATCEPIREYPEHTAGETAIAIREAVRAWTGWVETSFEERAERLRSAAGILRARQEELARLMTAEMGKVIREARAEVEKSAWVCEHYAEHAADWLADEPVDTPATRSYVAYRPLGPVLAIMPWNFPFWQVFRFAAPALMAGNAALLKHAPSTPGCAVVIEEIFRQAGCPEGLFRTLLIPVEEVGEVIDHPQVAAVTLTGGPLAGRAVAARAGAALKKTVLELGGSDPYVILEDADLDQAVPACVTARMINAGQSCIAGKRFIVVEPLRRAFEEALVEGMRARKMGDPRLEETDFGPLARRDLRENLDRQVSASVAAGARLLLGGAVPDGPGCFYPATVLTGVGPGQPAYSEELFGPVASVIAVRDEEEAVRTANDTIYGLGAAVFTADRQRGERIARDRLQAGCCFVNDYTRSDPRLPFGGIKASGYGRELALHGIREFVNVKTVWVR